jgi:hypothetical protein
MNGEPCPRCIRPADYSPPPRSHCANCTPPEERRQFFRFSIRVQDLEQIKAKHGNVSDYLRELVARDLGTNTCPPVPNRRKTNGETDLKELGEFSKPKSRRKKHANGAANHRKVGRIRAAQKTTNQS